MAIDEYAAIFKRCGTQLRFLSSSEYRLEFVAGFIQACKKTRKQKVLR